MIPYYRTEAVTRSAVLKAALDKIKRRIYIKILVYGIAVYKHWEHRPYNELLRQVKYGKDRKNKSIFVEHLKK